MKYVPALLLLLCFCDKDVTVYSTRVIKDTVKVFDTTKITQRLIEDLVPDYQLCDEQFVITGKIITNKKRKYTYIVTDGCSDSIGGDNGFQMLSDNEHNIGDKLHITKDFY